MPRKPRLFIPYATYHVYCRVARGEFVFANREDSDLFLETPCEIRDRDGLPILAWCLMANRRYGDRICDLAAILNKNAGP